MEDNRVSCTNNKFEIFPQNWYYKRTKIKCNVFNIIDEIISIYVVFKILKITGWKKKAENTFKTVYNYDIFELISV